MNDIIKKLGITVNHDIFLANDNRNYSKIITDYFEYIVDSTAPVSKDEQKIIHIEIRVMGIAPKMLEILSNIIKVMYDKNSTLANLNGQITNARKLLINNFPEIKELLS